MFLFLRRKNKWDIKFILMVLGLESFADWQAKWYAEKHYTESLQEDLKLRRAVEAKAAEGGIARVEIDHQGNEILLTIYSSRPGIVIGRGGQRAEELRSQLEKICGKRVRLSIKEVAQPELEAVSGGSKCS